MKRRFDTMRKEAGAKIMSAGMIIRIIILIALLAGGRFICENFKEEAYIYYEKDGN
jgi:hypothetical protein